MQHSSSHITVIVCIHFPLKHTVLAYSCATNIQQSMCKTSIVLTKNCPRRALIIMANCSQNPSNKSSNMYVIIELMLRTPGQQSTLRNCFCTEHKTRFAVSYTSQAPDRFHTTNAVCPSHLLSYALLTRCHPFVSQIAN